jgi:hypothetical protein
MSTRAGWLYSPARDVFTLAAPLTLALVAAAATHGLNITTASMRAAWLADFVLGNVSHVILTFLLLAVRRDVLHAAPGQARLVVGGAATTFSLGFLFFWAAHRAFPTLAGFADCTVLVFAVHHTLSQVRGLWALYGIRAARANLAAPTARERAAMKSFVPIALVAITTRFFFVRDPDSAFMPVFAKDTALLPHFVTYVLLGVWGIYAIATIATLVTTPRASIPKAIYVSSHALVVALMLVRPFWGSIVSAGIHGLEYYLLTSRMLRPQNASESLRAPWVVPAMLLTMFPLVLVGLIVGPLAPIFGGRNAPALQLLLFTLDSVVVAHYCVDAFIYRFRIPAVRDVVLSRLGMR